MEYLERVAAEQTHTLQDLFGAASALSDDDRAEVREHLLRVARRALTAQQLDVVALHLAGLSYGDIAREIGRDRSTVIRILRGRRDDGHGGRYRGALTRLIEACRDDPEFIAACHRHHHPSDEDSDDDEEAREYIS